jgi:hypothetical protein
MMAGLLQRPDIATTWARSEVWQTRTKRFADARECARLCCYSHSPDRAPVLIFRTGPVEQMDRANLIAGCSGYFDRISLALK